MANSYLNIVTFLLTTLFYYMALKPKNTYDISVDQKKNEQYISNSYMYLAIYLLLVIVIQFIVNASIISSTCGGNITENMGSAGMLTFLPWILIFCVMTLILTVYPGFKSAFSDVIGYFWVARSANDLLTELLINKDIEKILDKNDNSNVGKGLESNIDVPEPSAPTPVSNQTGDENLNEPVLPQPINPVRMVGGKKQFKNLKGGSDLSKEQIQEAADTIIKICGNTSVLINQIVPRNFNNYWEILKPLMKEKYRTDGPSSTDMKNKLFDIVVTRDDVGEAMWYIYTGLLLTSIVQLKMTTKGCSSNTQTMEQNYQQFLSNEKQTQAQNQSATSTTYTITN
jgi:hypothetical protein